MVTDRPTPREAADILCAGCENVVSREELEARLGREARLTVKLGIDPTGSFLHLGHAVVLHKMQQFVELGHRVILLIGDFTAKIGDPTGRNDTRPPLTDDMIAQNMHDYRAQAGKVLDLERIEVMQNSTWLGALSMSDLIGLMARTTVAQMLERNDFAIRYGEGTPIALHEFLYPIAQAYDSVAMRAGVELGGTDQLFNLLMGREYQAAFEQPKQICMTTPILEGLDGVVRMGKSRNNYVGIAEPANDQFGKLMSLPDEIMPRYAELAAFRPPAAVKELREGLATGTLHPMDAKKALAAEIVTRYHGADAARGAREHFEATIQRGEVPSDIAEFSLGPSRTVADVLLATGIAASKREAKTLIAGGGVKIDGRAVVDAAAPWNATAPAVLSVGRRFAKILPH